MPVAQRIAPCARPCGDCQRAGCRSRALAISKASTHDAARLLEWDHFIRAPLRLLVADAYDTGRRMVAAAAADPPAYDVRAGGRVLRGRDAYLGVLPQVPRPRRRAPPVRAGSGARAEPLADADALVPVLLTRVRLLSGD